METELPIKVLVAVVYICNTRVPLGKNGTREIDKGIVQNLKSQLAMEYTAKQQKQDRPCLKVEGKN